MTTEEKTEEQSYPQLLLARAKDRQRSFLGRGAWMLGYILLGIAMILCAMLWAVVKEIFQETPKQPEPESEDPFTDSDSLYYLHHNQQACEAMREGKAVFEYDPLKPF